MEPNLFRKFVEAKMAEKGEKPGKAEAIAALQEALRQRKFAPSDLSIRELYEAFVGPMPPRSRASFLTESAVDTSFFQHAAGVFITAALMEAYQAVPRVGRDLVKVIQTRKTNNRIVGYVGVEALKDVEQGAPYPDGTVYDRWADGTVGSKRGRILAITEEAINEDDTGQVLKLASDLGELAAEDEELHILEGIINPTYKPNSVSTAFYAAAGSLINDKTGNALKNYTSLEEVMKLAINIKGPNGRPMIVNFKVLLVPFSLLATANSIVNATQVVRSATLVPPDAKIETFSPTPLPVPKVVSTMLLDQITAPAGAAASNWYMGDPQKAFVFLEYWPLQVTAMPASSEDGFNRDVTFKYKVRRRGTLVAQDSRFFFRSRA